MTYGDTNHQQYRDDYDAAKARIEADAEHCRFCKTAKTKAAKALRAEYDADGKAKRPESHMLTLIRAANTAKCGTHARAVYMAYVTSPVSETYWAS
jgi:hypothetical protein